MYKVCKDYCSEKMFLKNRINRISHAVLYYLEEVKEHEFTKIVRLKSKVLEGGSLNDL